MKLPKPISAAAITMLIFTSCRPQQELCMYTNDFVKINIPEVAFDGYNLLNGCEIYDMVGNRMVTYPGYLCNYFQNGDIVAGEENQYLEVYKKDLTSIWKTPKLPFVSVHHEVFVAPDSSIYFLSSEHKLYKKGTHVFKVRPIIDSMGKPRVDPTMNNPMGDSLRFDVIYHYSRQGTMLSKWSSYDHITELNEMIANGRNEDYTDTLRRLPQEYFHFNSIQTLPHNPYENKDRAFKAGNLLLSEMYFDFILIIDPNTFNILWYYFQPEANGHGQHSARMLQNGNILMLVNQNSLPSNSSIKYSKAVELNPVTKKTEWEYIADPPQSLYSEYQGNVQRLPNGNTLITVDAYDQSCPYRSCHVPFALEVTRSKKVVWKWTPYGSTGQLNSNEEFYRVERLSKNQLQQFVESPI